MTCLGPLGGQIGPHRHLRHPEGGECSEGTGIPRLQETTPPEGPYSGPMPKALQWPNAQGPMVVLGGGAVSYG